MPKVDNSHKQSRLTFIKQTLWGKHPRAIYECTCGTIREFSMCSVRSKSSSSCGCYELEVQRKRLTKHGLESHKLYGVWLNIKQRCYNHKNRSYINYGAKGVYLCEEWKSDFKKFYDWCIENGWHDGLEIDKDIIPQREGIEQRCYSPETCCFVTPQENAKFKTNSHTLEFRGENRSMTEWSKITGVDYDIIKNRIKLGWDTDKILSTPIRRIARKKAI